MSSSILNLEWIVKEGDVGIYPVLAVKSVFGLWPLAFGLRFCPLIPIREDSFAKAKGRRPKTSYGTF